MNHKARHAEEKRNYEKMKDIRNRIKNNQPTTFEERNILNIYLKKLAKKKQLQISFAA